MTDLGIDPETMTASEHIRWLKSQGLTQRQIVERYDYSRQLVSYAIKYETARKRGRPRSHKSGDVCRRCAGTGREP